MLPTCPTLSLAPDAVDDGFVVVDGDVTPPATPGAAEAARVSVCVSCVRAQGQESGAAGCVGARSRAQTARRVGRGQKNARSTH